MNKSGNIVTLLLVLWAVAMTAIITGKIVYEGFREQAFERGYMVECLGKVGYHWECEDE